MPTLTVNVPSMYADHHVLRVREALTQLDGVTCVTARAGAKQVIIEHEAPATAESLQQALINAGYPPNQELPLAETLANTKDSSTWYSLVKRTTSTQAKDLEMSGDFRRY